MCIEVKYGVRRRDFICDFLSLSIHCESEDASMDKIEAKEKDDQGTWERWRNKDAKWFESETERAKYASRNRPNDTIKAKYIMNSNVEYTRILRIV